MKIILISSAILFVGLFILFYAYTRLKKIDRWLPNYFSGLLHKPKVKNKPIDIMFLFVNHFELNGKKNRFDAWNEGYPAIAKKHKDYDGCYPKHSFFYALDLMHEKELIGLQHLVEDGYGEFELHWHHAHDTPESFKKKLLDAMALFHKYGYMKPYQSDKPACFSFIHGNWSLANSRGNEFCGVDNELTLLKEMGCYADFTFPALFGQAQPPMINNIYYCKDLDKASCYFEGRDSNVGTKEAEDEFMIFQGPMTINWKDWRHKWHPTVEDGDINQYPTHSDPKRIKAWINQAIHVKGRPEWQFVKVFCHGAQDHKSVISNATDKMFSYLEENYNDGEKYRLHYVTAREAYNIVKAAEDGKSGNPNEFRDYEIPHPLNR